VTYNLRFDKILPIISRTEQRSEDMSRVSNILFRHGGLSIILSPFLFKFPSRFFRLGSVPIATFSVIYGIVPRSWLPRLSFVVTAKESATGDKNEPTVVEPSSTSLISSPPTSSPTLNPHIDSTSSSSASSEESFQKKKKSRLIDLVDAHNSRDDHVAIKRLLTEYHAEETDDPRLLWRYSRALYELSNGPSTDTNSDSKKDLLQEAFRLAKRAVDVAKSNDASAAKDVAKDKRHGGSGAAAASEAHLWYAIVLESLGKWRSLRDRIADAFVIKDHYLKSLQLKPQSAIVLHCLGSWCYTIASVNWFERKLAQWTAQDLPVSTFEEALGYFRAAEEVSPNFYSLNLLFIAKCYIQLKNEVKANEYLERVVNFAPLRSDEDRNAVKEAQRLLILED